MSMSAPVTQGRRPVVQTHNSKGTELPALVRTPSDRQLGSLDVRKVTVLSKADWEGIQYRLNKKQIEAEQIRKAQDEKRRLHELSLDRVKNWSNTVYGQRQKKLEDRRIRLEKEEEERKKIDVEEALFQAEKRKAAIEKAKLQQYYQTDRVKGFHSALLMTEVLKEREAQIELKRLRDKTHVNLDKDEFEKLRHDYYESLRIDAEEKQKVREAKMKTVAFQKAQMEQREREQDRQKQDELLEAEELKRLCEEFAEEERRKQEKRREMAAQQAADNRRQMADREMMKEIDRMQQEEEDEECRLFATAKRKMMIMRAEKERQLRAEKQAELQVIQDKLTAQMHQKVSNEESIIQAALQEREAKLAAEEAEKQERRARMLESIKKHRIEQAQLSKERTEAEKREAIESLKARLEADTIFARNEAEKLRQRKEEAKIFASVHRDQADERKENEKIKREQELEQVRHDRQLEEIQEAQFQAYAHDVIDHCEKRGRNTYPLRKVATQVVPGHPAQRPDYIVSDETRAELPSFQTCATDATKQNINGNTDTSKRLGFCF